jgi:ribosomal protein L11 methyltransferase
LGQIQAIPQPAYRSIEDEDWMAAWKKHYRPIPIGQRLIILPAWIEETDPTRVAVKIDPSMAFGTGTHPSTQLCLEMIEKHLRPGETVIDVGCGSGILSIAALKMGAAKALGVDIDSASVKSTRENAQANKVSAALEVGLGSVSEVLSGQFSLRQAPFVLANILAPVIIRLFAAGLADLVEPGGKLVLAGILADQAPSVLQAAAEHGLTHLETRTQLDWVALLLTR